MGKEEDAENQLKTLSDYLGYIDQGSIRFSQDNKMEDEILNGILSAIKDHKKFFIQVVKSFDLQNLNAVLVYLYRELIKKGIQVRLLRDLNYTTMGVDCGKGCVYLITERYLDVSEEETMKKLASLMSGHMPVELSGIPIILGLTENSLKLVDKYRSDNNPEYIYSDNHNKEITSPLIGVGFILLSLTFFITFVGLIIDRPRVLLLSFSVVSWVIFSASLIGVSGFIMLIAGSMKLPPKKATLIAEIILLIALLEIASIYVQLSGFSISPSPDGLHLATSFQVGSLGPAKLENAANVSIIYSLLSIFLAFTFYLLFYRFSGNFYRRIGLFALVTAVIGEMVSVISIYRGLDGFGLQSFIVHESGLLFLSFYNNISPLMPYPSILLNTSDFLFPFGGYSVDIFYLMLVTICASNFLFFISYLRAGLSIYGKKKQKTEPDPVSGS